MLYVTLWKLYFYFDLKKYIFLYNQLIKARQEQQLKEITRLIRRSFDMEDILTTTVGEVRQALKADRVLVYRFRTDWSGIVIAESVAAGFPQALMQEVEDACFQENYFQLYQNGRVRAIGNIYKAGLANCHINNLERLAVKAGLIAPILKNGKLFGLLIAHHCSRSREWYKYETDLFAQIATQVGFALKRSELEEKLKLNILDSNIQIILPCKLLFGLRITYNFNTIATV